jgi:hypothetical protein
MKIKDGKGLPEDIIYVSSFTCKQIEWAPARIVHPSKVIFQADVIGVSHSLERYLVQMHSSNQSLGWPMPRCQCGSSGKIPDGWPVPQRFHEFENHRHTDVPLRVRVKNARMASGWYIHWPVQATS